MSGRNLAEVKVGTHLRRGTGGRIIPGIISTREPLLKEPGELALCGSLATGSADRRNGRVKGEIREREFPPDPSAGSRHRPIPGTDG